MFNRPHTILIIDDDLIAVRTLYESLKASGYRLLGARRAVDGLDIARRERPSMVITGIYLPDMTARELAVMLRSDRRFVHTPIVGLSDNITMEERALSLAVGITGFIDKPIDPHTIVEHVEYFMHGGRDGVVSDTGQLEMARMAYLRDVVSRLEGRIRDLEDSNRELTELDRTKDDFIQLASHELRTPLTLITGYMRLLIDAPELNNLMDADENTRMLFHGLADSVDRMQDVVEEILTTSRIIVNRIDLNIRETNMAELVQNVVNNYSQAMQLRNIQLRYRQYDWPTQVHVDPEMIYVAINNLLSNAIKYTPDGGQVYLNCAYNTEKVQFSVRDTGIGIAPEKQANIFKRMHITGDIQLHSTSKTAFGGGGLGLGLSICHGIIEAHQGKIWVQSDGHDPEAMPGSEFFVELPIEHPDAMTQKNRKLSPDFAPDIAN
ncbi:MAG: hypothetical protein CL607_12115 [Anaerolineaceae bacterium]|nr:hypothetical protein [Anaerolineaceae bacterium]